MPIVHPCATDGCNTLTMGELCLDCELELAAEPVVEEEPVVVTAAPT